MIREPYGARTPRTTVRVFAAHRVPFGAVSGIDAPNGLVESRLTPDRESVRPVTLTKSPGYTGYGTCSRHFDRQRGDPVPDVVFCGTVHDWLTDQLLELTALEMAQLWPFGRFARHRRSLFVATYLRADLLP